MGDIPNTLEFFEKRNQLGEELYRDYPNQVDFKNGLAISYAKLAIFHRDNHNKDAAIDYFKQAEKLWLELTQAVPQAIEYQRFLEEVQKDLDNLNNL